MSASLQGTLRDTKCVSLPTVMLEELSLLWLETTSHYTQSHPGTALYHNVTVFAICSFSILLILLVTI